MKNKTMIPYRPGDEKEFQIRLKNFIRKNFGTGSDFGIQLAALVVLVLLGRFRAIFSGKLMILFYLILGAGIFVLLGGLQNKRKKRVYNLLTNAIAKISSKSYYEAIEILLEAYEQMPDQELWDIIDDFTSVHKPSLEQEARIAELLKKQKKNKKDDKLNEILSQITDVNNFIDHHRNQISDFLKKINELQNQLKRLSDSKLKDEYNNLINRYENIVSLENAKIDFYTKALEELLKLKERHIHTYKLLEEKQRLGQLEENLLTDNYKELETSELEDFLIYENQYLKALRKYGLTISQTSDKDLFEDIKKEFEVKKSFLR